MGRYEEAEIFNVPLQPKLKNSVKGFKTTMYRQIPKEDTVVLTTAREENIRDHTIRMLKHFSIRYDRIMFSLRSGPRYVINDIKPVGVVGNSEPLKMAFAINVERDTGITKEDLCL